jgi:hypothetical protein
LKTVVYLILLLILPSAAVALEPLLDQPRWSLEIRGGKFAPVLDNWSHYYGKSTISEYGVSLAYKVLQQVEIGAGVGSMKAKGQVTNQFHNQPAGEVSYDLNPINIFIMLRGVTVDDQWLVPYIGGGWTRMYFREEVPEQFSVRGFADGYHVRGGLQLSLDNLDHEASSSMFRDYGVIHTYFFIEAEHTAAVQRSTSINLGGTAYLGGLLFEF